MKQYIYLTFMVLTLTCINGCISSEGYPTTFEKQYKQLEKETKNYDSKDFYDAEKRSADDKRTMNEGDRFAAVQIEAQKERRATKKIVESDYYFQVYPGRQESYSFNEYNEVWSDGYPLNAYKETNRLWNKPQKFKPEEYSAIPDDGLVTEQAVAAAEEAAAKAEKEAADAAAESDTIYE